MIEGLIENGTISDEDKFRTQVKLQTEAITRGNQIIQRQAQMINTLLIVVLGLMVVLMVLVGQLTM